MLSLKSGSTPKARKRAPPGSHSSVYCLYSTGTAVPVLYKQYTELCEPGGARFLAFGVDPDFSDSIDGLIEVDLQQLQARKRRRYLREGETA